MTRPVSRRSAETIGPFRLVKPLGVGSNSEVWGASRGAEEVAVKLLRVRNPASEPYRRFRDEIDILGRLGTTPGVLPLLDYHLPEAPNRRDPAWLAMPIATPIRTALEGAELSDIVSTFARLAGTLVSLAQRGVYHRDIKPENLYRHDGDPTIGDFGLAEFPEKEALTEPGGKIGPLHFLAPEMLESADTVDGGPADVYSLLKTFWVLACGQRFPPQGEQRRDTRGVRIRDYVSHPRTGLLDQLIERGTRHDPGSRPSMEEVGRELSAWLYLETAVKAPNPDLAELEAEVRATFAPEVETAALRAEWDKHVREIFTRLNNAVEEAGAAMAGLGMVARTTSTRGLDPLQSYLPRASIRATASELYGRVAQSFAEGPAPEAVTLRVAAGLHGFDDGTVDLAAAHLIGFHGLVQDQLWRYSKTVPIGSAEEELAIREILLGLHDQLRASVEELLSRIRGTKA